MVAGTEGTQVQEVVKVEDVNQVEGVREFAEDTLRDNAIRFAINQHICQD